MSDQADNLRQLVKARREWCKTAATPPSPRRNIGSLLALAARSTTARTIPEGRSAVVRLAAKRAEGLLRLAGPAPSRPEPERS